MNSCAMAFTPSWLVNGQDGILRGGWQPPLYCRARHNWPIANRPAACQAVVMDLWSTKVDENSVDKPEMIVNRHRIGQGRWRSGYVEADKLSDPERAFEQINVSRGPRQRSCGST